MNGTDIDEQKKNISRNLLSHVILLWFQLSFKMFLTLCFVGKDNFRTLACAVWLYGWVTF